MNQKIRGCIDAGSEYCPCYLAELNECIACSHLRGKDYCDCVWSGVCIFNEYYMNGQKSKNKRKDYICEIIKDNFIKKDLKILKLRCPEELVDKLNYPGSYVFLRDLKSENFFDAPMSIMNIYGDEVLISYQIAGPKTKSLNCIKEEILLRGPYYNGIIGIKHLDNIKNSSCLIIARGIGQSSVLLAIKKLLKNNNKVFLILDEGKTGLYITNFIKDLKLITSYVDILKVEGQNKIKDILLNNDIKLVLSAGSNLLHRNIYKIVNDIGLDPYFLVTNNNYLCCGEGLCGACIVKLKDGERVRACKTIFEYKDVLDKGGKTIV